MKRFQIPVAGTLALFALNLNAQTPVEVKLIAAIEEDRGWCLDLRGGQNNGAPIGGLHGHTCYTYNGRGPTPDQAFVMENIVENPSVGIIFFVPGVEETLRVNGRATIVDDEAILSGMIVLFTDFGDAGQELGVAQKGAVGGVQIDDAISLAVEGEADMVAGGLGIVQDDVIVVAAAQGQTAGGDGHGAGGLVFGEDLELVAGLGGGWG